MPNLLFHRLPHILREIRIAMVDKMAYNRCGDHMATKTNAVRLVEQAKIPCREHFYEFDEKDLNGNHAAEAIGMPPEQVFKTLVARGERTGVNVFCIPVCCELDLKKAAKAACDKSIEMLPVKDLLATTGYIRGGCTSIGMKKKFKTFIQKDAESLGRIAVSGGRRGLQLFLKPDDLQRAAEAEYADVIFEHA